MIRKKDLLELALLKIESIRQLGGGRHHFQQSASGIGRGPGPRGGNRNATTAENKGGSGGNSGGWRIF